MELVSTSTQKALFLALIQEHWITDVFIW